MIDVEHLITTAEAKCQDCYRCLRSCPVHAIRFTKGSCEEEMIRAAVMEELCILDGRCVNTCPQQAKKIRNDLGVVQEMVAGDDPVIASVAPSFPGALSSTYTRVLPTILNHLGFSGVQETAFGAELVATKHRSMLKENDKTISYPQITSSCPVIVNIVERHYPQLLSHLAPLVSPMVAHALHIKKEEPESRVVFIGPCFAKKKEVEQSCGAVDAALTFLELESWIRETISESSLKGLEPTAFSGPRPDTARLFPIDGGLMRTAFGSSDLLSEELVVVSGVDECIQTIENLTKGDTTYSCRFIEMLSCHGGCINGPGTDVETDTHTRRQQILDYYQTQTNGDHSQTASNTEKQELDLFRRYIDRRPEQKDPDEEEIAEILANVGKFTPEDELNCGACGFDSCRDKAVAVYRGYADPEMCIPYMRSKAESIANTVINALPTVGLVVTDLELNLVEMNQAAREMFQKTDFEEGEELSDLFDPSPFVRVKENQRFIKQRVSYPELSLVTDQHIFYMGEHRLIVGVIIDVTEEERRKEKAQKMRESAVTQIQEVIDRQMKVVQEIAGILGETTAETKVELKNLIKVMEDEE